MKGPGLPDPFLFPTPSAGNCGSICSFGRATERCRDQAPTACHATQSAVHSRLAAVLVGLVEWLAVGGVARPVLCGGDCDGVHGHSRGRSVTVVEPRFGGVAGLQVQILRVSLDEGVLEEALKTTPR